MKLLARYGILSILFGLGLYFHPIVYGIEIPIYVGIIILICGVALIFVSILNDDNQDNQRN